MDWFEAVEQVGRHVVKIETPGGHGTGFLCTYNQEKTFCGVATAYHVVKDADYWQQPLRISHLESLEPAFVKESDRVIFSNEANDSAVIFFRHGNLKLPESPLPMIEEDQILKIGVEVGWLGYPSVAPSTLCFFSGNISAQRNDSYFIDGVAINGVSGGPVFSKTRVDEGSDDEESDDEGSIEIIGAISAYYPNFARGSTLPGLSFAQDVTYFHNTIARIRSLDEARAKQKEDEEKAETQSSAGSEPSEPTKNN